MPNKETTTRIHKIHLGAEKDTEKTRTEETKQKKNNIEFQGHETTTTGLEAVFLSFYYSESKISYIRVKKVK